MTDKQTLQTQITQLKNVLASPKTDGSTRKILQNALNKAESKMVELEKAEKLESSKKALTPKQKTEIKETKKETKSLADSLKEKVKKAKQKIVTTTPKATTKKGGARSVSKAKQIAKEMRSKQAKQSTKDADIESDARRFAINKIRRTSKGGRANQYGTKAENKGGTYYEYRENRYDRQNKRYAKLEDGGMMADGGGVGFRLKEGYYWVGEPFKSGGMWSQRYAYLSNQHSFVQIDEMYGKTLSELMEKINKKPYKRISIEDFRNHQKYRSSKQDNYADGGMMAKGGETQPYIIWVSKDDDKRELYGTYKSQRAAEMAMKKLWDNSDYSRMGNKTKSMYEKEGLYADGGLLGYASGGSATSNVGGTTFADGDLSGISDIDLSGGLFAKGGSISNQYKGRKPEDIWDSWTISQRVHFLKDHYLPNLEESLSIKEMKEVINSIDEVSLMNWDKLPSSVHMEVERHIFMGQYAHGGMTEHGLMIGDTIISTTNEPYSVVVRNNGKQAIVDLNEGTREEDTNNYAHGGQTRFKSSSGMKYEDKKINVGDFVMVDNPHWKGSTGVDKAVKRKVKMVYGDYPDGEVFFSDGSNSSLKYVKKLEDGGLLGYANGGSATSDVGGTTFSNGDLSGISDIDLSGGMFAKGGMIDIKKIRKEYEENEDNNAHSENVVLLAKHFGTESDLRDARIILSKHESIGHLPSYLAQERDELSRKLYKKMVEASTKMAKGGGVGAEETKEMWMVIDSKTKDVVVLQLFLYEFQAEDKIKSLIKVKSLSKYDKLEVIKIFVSKVDYLEYKKIRSDLFEIKGKDNFWKKRSGATSRVSDLETKEKNLLEKIKKYNSNKMANGGMTSFKDKVTSISKRLLKDKKVSPKVQKDYGKTYNKKEALESAKRIAGALRKKEMAKKKS